MSSETEFTAQLWSKLKEYLEKYTINGHKLVAREPNSVKLKGGKLPDIVIVDTKGISQFIIELL